MPTTEWQADTRQSSIKPNFSDDYAVLARFCFLATALSWQTGVLAILHGVLHAVRMDFLHLLAIP